MSSTIRSTAMATDELASGRKHGRSPDHGADEGSKRRKHHHKHHRHHKSHGHRHHRKRDQEKQEGDRDLPFTVIESRPEDDKEEGEILEEEEEEEEARDYTSKKKADSDVESGEIKPDETADDILYLKSDRSTVHGEGEDTFSHKGPEELNVNLPQDDGVDENNLTSYISTESRNDITLNLSIDARNGTAKDSKLKPPIDFMVKQLVSPPQHQSSNDYYGDVVDLGGEIGNGLRTETFASGAEEYAVGKSDALSVEFKSCRSRQEVQMTLDNDIGRHHSESAAFDTKLGGINGDIGSKSSKGDRRHTRSKSPLEGAGEEKNHRDVESSYLKRHTRSISPVATERLNSSKHRKRDDRVRAVDHSRDVERGSERDALMKHAESIDANRHSSENKKRSVSPQNLRDKYKNARHSPSYEKHHDEVRNRNRSRSRDRAREMISLARSDALERDFQQTVHSQEHGAKFYMDNSVCTKPSDFIENNKNGSDLERVVRYDRGDRHDNRDKVKEADVDRAIRRERERSGSYSRHGERENRHSSLDRDRERDKAKEMRNERARSSSYSRHGGRDDQHSSWERERDRDRENGRDRNRELRYRERNSDRGRDREMDSDRGRDRERDSDRGRDRERVKDREKEMYRDRISRHKKYDGVEDRHGSRDRYNDSRYPRHDEMEHRRDKTISKQSAKGGFTKHDMEERKEKSIREEDEQENFQERIALKLAEQEEEDIEKIKEESRKRRQAILEKYKQQQSQLQVEAPSDATRKEERPFVVDAGKQTSPPIAVVNAVSLVSLKGLENRHGKNRHDSTDVYVADSSFSLGKSPPQNGTAAIEKNPGAGGLGDGTPKSERSADMFCDDIFGESPAGVRKSSERSADMFCDDIFGESPAGVRKSRKGDGLQVDRNGLHDNWDDAEGYYSYRFGEVLDGRYEVIAAHGKGVFSTVVRAKDLKAGKADPEEVAIKIIRNNETMYKAGLEELIILKKLAGADPEDKRHCVRFLSSFKYRNHLCLVFESLHMNLREVLKKFGRNIGLKLTAVRAYAKQLFIALKHLRNCGVLHCDIKPDNMLVNEAKNVLKLCDFGNAMFAGKNEITPYLVSRFYRAPEIILGLAYDHPMDIWSIGCCLYELYSGKVLFPGPSNNDMLRLHMELKGSFPKKMLRKGAFTDQHFDQDLNFHATEEDPVTKKTVKRLLLNIKPKDIASLITSAPGEDPKMLANFKDLLERVFVLDPEKRMTVSQALSHPFIMGK
ncbi:protein kinase superfamily protein [Tasmannia lanceolata]|uniref:protein kinase superfamily protein n=1 Tax=Tasmannia lanceolata TaxID=3420 RepID=UPI004062AC0E